MKFFKFLIKVGNNFFIDENRHIKISYSHLIEKFAKPFNFAPIYSGNSTYEFFINFLVGLLYDENIYLADLDLTPNEKTQLQNEIKYYNPLSKTGLTIQDMDDFLKKITESKSSIFLFTSGTTGQPKMVKHNIGNLIRNVKNGDKFKDNVWGLCYNPTHMAGIQVFFQAILNQNTIINLFNQPPDYIAQQINKHNITHLSATPTFYRLLTNNNYCFASVSHITFGGEKSSEDFQRKVQQIFPNAKMHNIYASTEAGSLLNSINDSFIIPEQYNDKIKIENNELFVHKSLLGESENLSEEWYNTGDLIEYIDDTKTFFRFLARKNEMINIGGYKVNPNEVEETIFLLPYIKKALVYGKKNSVTGNILICEIVTDNKYQNEKEIRSFLSEKLQDFKVPRIIKFVDDIQTTRTNKTKRT